MSKFIWNPATKKIIRIIFQYRKLRDRIIHLHNACEIRKEFIICIKFTLSGRTTQTGKSG